MQSRAVRRDHRSLPRKIARDVGGEHNLNRSERDTSCFGVFPLAGNPGLEGRPDLVFEGRIFGGFDAAGGFDSLAPHQREFRAVGEILPRLQDYKWALVDGAIESLREYVAIGAAYELCADALGDSLYRKRRVLDDRCFIHGRIEHQHERLLLIDTLAARPRARFDTRAAGEGE